MITRLAIFSMIICLVAAACSHVKESTQAPLIVTTQAGRIKGILENDVFAFKGVPFAAPPVGELRWKEPQPLEPWNDTLSCSEFRASPMQNEPKAFRMWTEEFQPPVKPISEDCLYLNIWTPSTSSTEKLPVMIWIPGGGFVNGSGSVPIYNGEAFAREGIVYVSINYRVNIFGFMAHPQLSAESGRNSSGNYGIMDQIAAIKWVKNNIEAFGGDPERITIAGQSAGSASVQAVVSSPLAHDLFQGVIAQSGTLTGRRLRTLEEGEQIGMLLSEKFRLPGIAAMRNLSADSILAIGNTLPFGSFGPIMDGYVIPDDLKEKFEKGKSQQVPLMAGWVTGDAMRDPRTLNEFRDFAAENYKGREDEFFKLFPATSDEVSAESQHKLALVQSLVYPYSRWAASNTGNSYLYQFTFVPVDKPDFPNYGAFHSAEIPYAFHSLKYWDRPWRAEDYAVQKYMSAYWMNFVKTGNPNGNGLAAWKPYDESGNIMELGSEPILKQHLYKEELEFINSTTGQ